MFFLCAFCVEKWSQSEKKSIFFCFLKNPDNFLSKSVPIVSVAPKLYFLAQLGVWSVLAKMGFYVGIGSWPYRFLYKIPFWPKLAKLQPALKKMSFGAAETIGTDFERKLSEFFKKQKKNRFFFLL